MSFSLVSEGNAGDRVCLALSTESMVESDGLFARLRRPKFIKWVD